MINSELKHTDFSRYTFEEFLQNDFFISSVKYPTEEIQEFWDRFEKSTPSNIDDYFAAREYIETISTSEGDLLSESCGLISRQQILKMIRLNIKTFF